jgi:MOSC domain-containing protein YiiM
VIEELAADGHPIAAGRAGENLTLRGLAWDSLRPGSRLRVGSALVELSFPAVPCSKQTQWFADGDFKRIAYEVNPQWVRWYGWVRERGDVAPGDTVVVQPAPASV